MAKKKQQPGIRLFEGWTFTRKNYIVFSIGLFMVIVGYVVMATGEVNSFQSLTIAPIMLFLGYVIIIPAALILRDKASRISGSPSSSPGADK